jgi:hypothetical protein
MKCLGWGVLVPSLLIVGVLGGLMAPLPSEAVTSLQFKVDNSTYTINLTQTCTAAERPAGYTACFKLPSSATTQYSGTNAAGNTRAFTIQNAPSTTARLLVADTAGAGNSLDQFVLTGVQFVPLATSGWPATEQHVLRVIMRNTFNVASNAAGNYLFALRTGGYFVGGPATDTTVNGSPLNDYVKFEGVGTFSSSLVNVPLLGVAPNVNPLSRQVGSPASKSSSFSLGQNVAYPVFACNNGSGRCTPDITLTMTTTLYGPDTLVLTNSDDSAGGTVRRCRVRDEDDDDRDRHNLGRDDDDDQNRQRKCKSITKRIRTFFQQQAAADATTAAAAGAVPSTQCVGEACPCADPDTCPVGPSTGTITITKNTSQETSDTFQFAITGPSPSTPSIPLGGANTATTVVTVNAGGPYSIEETPIPAGWTLGAANCNDGPTTFTVPAGGNVTCSFNNIAVPIQGTITINKFTAQPTSDIFHFTITTSGLDPLHTTVSPSGGTFGSTSVVVDAGTYNISEDSISGWSLLGFNCDGTITVPAGGTVTCNFTNVLAPVMGTIRIVKSLTGCAPSCPAATFQFEIQPLDTSVAITTAVGTGEGSIDVPVEATPGTLHSVTETPAAGYHLENSGCQTGPSNAFTVPSNGVVRCDFVNMQN